MTLSILSNFVLPGVSHKILSEQEAEQQIKALMANPTSRSNELNSLTSKVVTHQEFKNRIMSAVNRGNKKLMNVEKVGRAFILDRDFSQEMGELTPTMKVKRNQIEKDHHSIFDKMYQNPLPSDVLDFAR